MEQSWRNGTEEPIRAHTENNHGVCLDHRHQAKGISKRVRYEQGLRTQAGELSFLLSAKLLGI